MKTGFFRKTIAIFICTVWGVVSCSQNQLSVPKLRGETSSSGGGVYEDGLNPWFLENTDAVSYCIEADPIFFRVPLSQLEKTVKSAIVSWKRAFQLVENASYSSEELEPFGQVRLATQNFVQENCRASTTLRFQFGVLSKEQKRDYLPEPTQIIAEAVRTHYDKVSLRARGFVYVSPGAGALRPTSSGMAEDPWAYQDGLILKRVLLHELGHVFGLAHSGSSYELMGAGHPEYLVQKSTIEKLSKSNPQSAAKALSSIGIFGFEFPSEREVCDDPNSIGLGVPSVMDQFFGVPANTQCRKLRFLGDSIEVYVSSFKGGEYEFIGSTKAEKRALFSKAVSRIKLPSSQKVFNKIPLMAQQTGYLDGPATAARSVLKTYYESRDGKHFGFLKATFVPNDLFSMEVTWNNEPVVLFEYGG